MQAVRHLFAWDRTRVVCVNAENLVGHTAWDMLQDQGNNQIRVMLRCAGALPSRSLLTNTSSYADFYILPKQSCYADYLRRPKVEFLERFRTICLFGGCCTTCNSQVSSCNQPVKVQWT